MSSSDERVEMLAKVLDEHRMIHRSIEGANTSCAGCKWATFVPFGGSAVMAHHQHLAQALLDSPAMRDLLAEERAKALREAAEVMPFGYTHAAHILRARAHRKEADR